MTDNNQGTLLGGVGIGLQVAGAVGSALGTYYSIKAAQYRANSQALNLEFQQEISYIVARTAERDAQHTLLAGQRAAGRVGLQYRQLKEATITRQSAAGIQAGVGSAAEVATSIELAKETDQLAITRNSVRAANAHRTGRVNARNRAQFAGVSAENLRRDASALSPFGSAATTLVGGAGQVASTWYKYNRTT